MSDVEDSEFYMAFEDELYKETKSDNSSDAIDSELEEELYQNIHFASLFVPKPSEKEQKKTDTAVEESTKLLEPKDERTKSPVDEIDGGSTFFIDKKPEDGSHKYPEVKPVFADEKKVGSIKQETVILNTSGHSESHDESKGDWGIHAADLVHGSSGNSKKKRNYIRCFNCNERGHRTFECTQTKKDKFCLLCGKRGHLVQKCPNELCFNCQEPGHQLRQCKKPRCRPDFTCHRCHAYGHFENLCPDKWRQYHLTVTRGNIICPKEAFRRHKDNFYCYNCGAKGHLGHECLEKFQNGRFDGSYPFVVKYDKFTSSYLDENDYKPYYPKHKVFSDEQPRKRRKMEDKWEYGDHQGDQEGYCNHERGHGEQSGTQGNCEKNTSPKEPRAKKQKTSPSKPDEPPRNVENLSSEQPVKLTKRQIRRANRIMMKEKGRLKRLEDRKAIEMALANGEITREEVKAINRKKNKRKRKRGKKNKQNIQEANGNLDHPTAVSDPIYPSTTPKIHHERQDFIQPVTQENPETKSRKRKRKQKSKATNSGNIEKEQQTTNVNSDTHTVRYNPNYSSNIPNTPQQERQVFFKTDINEVNETNSRKRKRLSATKPKDLRIVHIDFNGYV